MKDLMKIRLQTAKERVAKSHKRQPALNPDQDDDDAVAIADDAVRHASETLTTRQLDF